MLDSAFDLFENLKLKDLSYSLEQSLWTKYDLSAVDISFKNWKSLKYLNATGDNFNPDVESLPNDAGGLYLFYIQCPVIIGMTELPCYIGRAQLTDHQNLRKRVKEYFLKFSRNNERPKITRMFKYWSNELHLAYLPLVDNASIIDFEKKLINSLLLPMNDKIPDVEIGQAVQAL